MHTLKKVNVSTSGKNKMEMIAFNVILGKQVAGMEQWCMKAVSGPR
jgi:hypothetical protein